MSKRRRPNPPDDRPSDAEPAIERPGDGAARDTGDDHAPTPAAEPALDPQSGSAESASTETEARPEVAPSSDDGDGSEDPNPEDPSSEDLGPPPPRPPRRHGVGLAIALLALLLALAAAGAVGWGLWRLMQLEQQVAAIPQQRRAALEPLASAQAVHSLQGHVDEVTSRIEQQLAQRQEARSAALEPLRQRLATAETAIQSMRELRQRTGMDWRMAEVRYLVSMAVNRLEIASDVRGAIAALQAADATLGRMGDPRVLDLRERVIEGIGDLKAVQPADVAGIALRIQNLTPDIAALVRVPAEPADGAGGQGGSRQEGLAGAADSDGWWAAIREQLGELVTIRREAHPTPPDPSRPAAARVPAGQRSSTGLTAPERLLLALQDARRAALHHDPRAYDAAVGRALTILDQAYADSAPVNQRFRQALVELRGRRVVTELPSLMPILERAQDLAARSDSGPGASSQGGR